MGSILYRRTEFAGVISELAGYKSGLALTAADIEAHVPEFSEYLSGDADDLLRIRSEEVEQLFGSLLFSLGAASSPGHVIPHLSYLDRFRGDRKAQALLSTAIKDLGTWMAANPGPVDVVSFLESVERSRGRDAAALSFGLLESMQDSIHRSPWSTHRRIEWHETRELDDLFKSSRLATRHGRHFDQRFVDYLERNCGALDRIHWRQFEGLTAEFFDREGYRVELGPGSNDDGVDLRLWHDDESGPPAMLVQCKRQKEKVGKVVVKALYSDVAHEHAAAGLIVTTSSLTPGARKVLTARSYPVGEADRASVEQWLRQMRTPGTGVFLAE